MSIFVSTHIYLLVLMEYTVDIHIRIIFVYVYIFIFIYIVSKQIVSVRINEYNKSWISQALPFITFK